VNRDGTTVTYQEDAREAAEYRATPGAASAFQGKGIKGLYFTVQVGAYSKPIAAASLYNITPLVYFKVNNLFKYSTGVFSSVAEATVRRDEVRRIGIQDAFVTAYFDGERISVGDAERLLAERGPSILTSMGGGQALVSEDDGTLDKVEVDGLNYYVFLGKFEDEVPAGFARIMLSNSDRDIRREQDDNGNTVFQTASVTKFSQALQQLDYFSNEGVQDARIVAVYGNKEISLQEAEQIRKGEVSQPIATPPANSNNTPSTNTQTTNTPTVERTEDGGVLGLQFFVFLGKFADEVPARTAMVFIRNSDKNIRQEEDENFETTYMSGSYPTYQKADEMRVYFQKEGITDARVFAVYKLKDISIEEAKKMTGE
jgi:hypothetical protein